MPSAQFGWPAVAALAVVVCLAPQGDLRDGANAAPAAHAVAARDGPFGIAIGEPLSALGPVRPDTPGEYVVGHPPRPSALFPMVAVVAYPSTGVCEIQGLNSSIPYDSKGEALKRAVDEAAAALQVKYGPAVKVDSCTSDVGCDDQWMVQLVEHSATYLYKWVFTDPDRPDHIRAFIVTASDESYHPTVAVDFAGTNSEACNAAKAAANAGGL